MVSFPIFDSLSVTEFGLYPGPSKGQPGLHISFKKGMTLVVGANGLGKTTLINIIYRMLTGPFDIPSLSGREELGSLKLAAAPLNTSLKKIFASRVSDGGEESRAVLKFSLGDNQFEITRRLSDLSLVSCVISHQTVASEESLVQQKLIECAGVASFGDFILMLRYLVFYFEDRKALIWDASAQRQVLRMLFLPPSLAQRWTELEREILTEDSRLRNLNAVVTREESNLSKSLVHAHSAIALRAELDGLEKHQEVERLAKQGLDSQTTELDANRRATQLAHLKAEQERETRLRTLEHAKLAAIDKRFPSQSETGKFILAHLMTESECLVCGASAIEAAELYTHRLHEHHCVLCDTDLSMKATTTAAVDLADERMNKARDNLNLAEKAFAKVAADRKLLEDEYRAHIRELTELESRIAERSHRIETIIEMLPPSEQGIRKQKDELSAMRGRLESVKSDLESSRSKFRHFIAKVSTDLITAASNISETFASYAGGFLSESVSLTWSKHSAKIGQGGEAIDFPSFDLDMSGSDFSEQVRRAGPGDVSESQREFVDLAFRMALIKAASHSQVGSLVIDAPESSLDAVFAKRAASILLRFADPKVDNRLIVTSNLVEGSLIPSLIRSLKTSTDGSDRVVDLFDIARPTAAMIAAKGEYDDLRQRMLG